MAILMVTGYAQGPCAKELGSVQSMRYAHDALPKTER